MNPNDELELLRRLRQLRPGREPQNDLWPAISARIAALPAAARPASRRRGMLVFALAASTLLAVVLVNRGADEGGADYGPAVAESAPPASRAQQQFVRREAAALTLEYQLAIDGLSGGPLAPEYANAMRELDRSAQNIRTALRSDPEAIYLLDRLRHTYDQRLKLTQRALVG